MNYQNLVVVVMEIESGQVPGLDIIGFNDARCIFQRQIIFF